MPIYLYWGEDEFALNEAVKELRERVLDSQWASFNYDKFTPDQSDAIVQALNQAMTPPFGTGGRFVWLVNTTICQQCSEQLLTELKRTLAAIPDCCTLLLTMANKPDARLKSTKLLQEHAEIREFSLIPPWKTEQLVERVQQVAQEKELIINRDAAELLAQSVGNDTRLLYNEIEKLKLYIDSPINSKKPIDKLAIAALVTSNSQSSLDLVEQISKGNTSKALGLVSDLINRNEPALKIVATLIGQFRTWLWVKLMVETGEKDDSAIASAAEVGNPKRIYFLKQQVRDLRSNQLISTLQILLELEVSLKRGADALSTLQTKVIQLCQLYKKAESRR